MLGNDKFLIIKNIKSFIMSLEKIIETFPKKDIITRNMIYQDSLNLLEIIEKANFETRSEIRKTYQIEAMAKVCKIDFYLERAYKFRYLSEKQLMIKSNELIKINKMLYKWCHNDK